MTAHIRSLNLKIKAGIVFEKFTATFYKIQRLSLGAPKIFNFRGEEKWRQAKLAREFHLASPFRRRSGGN